MTLTLEVKYMYTGLKSCFLGLSLTEKDDKESHQQMHYNQSDTTGATGSRSRSRCCISCICGNICRISITLTGPTTSWSTGDVTKTL